MTVTQELMRPGTFDVKLSPTTPRRVRDALYTHSTIVVTPTRLDQPAPTRAQVLAAARWSGILREKADHDLALSGPGILAWLGDDDDPKKGTFTRGMALGPKTFAEFLDTCFNVLTPQHSNGLTRGTDYSLPAGDIYDWISPYEAPLRAFERFARLKAVQWRVNADGSFDSGARGSALFRTTPTVLITEGAPPNVDDLTFTVVAGHVDVSRSATDYATDVTADGDGVISEASTLFTRPTHFDGTNDAYLEKYTTTQSTDATENADKAAYDLLYVYADKTRLEVTARHFDPAGHLEPGDNVYLYAPDLGISDTANQVWARGELLFPYKVQCTALRWPIAAGMGLYAISSDGANTVTDLTEWFEPEDGDTSIEVGARLPGLRQKVNGWG